MLTVILSNLEKIYINICVIVFVGYEMMGDV